MVLAKASAVIGPAPGTVVKRRVTEHLWRPRGFGVKLAWRPGSPASYRFRNFAAW